MPSDPNQFQYYHRMYYIKIRSNVPSPCTTPERSDVLHGESDRGQASARTTTTIAQTKPTTTHPCSHHTANKQNLYTCHLKNQTAAGTPRGLPYEHRRQDPMCHLVPTAFDTFDGSITWHDMKMMWHACSIHVMPTTSPSCIIYQSHYW